MLVQVSDYVCGGLTEVFKIDYPDPSLKQRQRSKTQIQLHI